MPGARCTRSLACRKKKAHEHSHHGHTGNHPAFPAQWFYGLYRALPGDHACLTPSPALLLADLTPTIGASEPHDFAVRCSTFVTRAARVHRIPPHVDDVRNAPLLGRMTRISELIWLRREAKYFCKEVWTTQISLSAQENLLSARKHIWLGCPFESRSRHPIHVDSGMGVNP
jgi:hypothetical protein